METGQDLPLSQCTRRRLGAWFRTDDPADADLIANAGRGSLLDSRWELAKDSKLGVFQLRGYKARSVGPRRAIGGVR